MFRVVACLFNLKKFEIKFEFPVIAFLKSILGIKMVRENNVKAGYC